MTLTVKAATAMAAIMRASCWVYCPAKVCNTFSISHSSSLVLSVLGQKKQDMTFVMSIG